MHKPYTVAGVLGCLVIVLMLAVTILPIYGTADEDAARRACMNNLKELGRAAAIYMHDYDGFFPSGDPNGKYNDGSYALQKLASYIDDARDADGKIAILDKKLNATTKLLVCPASDSGKFYGSYGWNAYTVNSPCTDNYGYHKNLKSVKDAATLLLMADSDWHTLAYTDRADRDGSGWPKHVRYRHNGTANILFVDGHVAATSISLVKQKDIMFVQN
ncbi:MAG: hypothetical protein PHT33_01230 [bacterium]|nr:hypothetical protein [bacterium]